MTIKTRSSPRPLTVYPHLHRNSQCGSCSTVMPGDICFNCGRLSTLLVTPRPPRKSMKPCTSSTQGPAPAQSKPLLQNKPFLSQHDRVQASLLAQESAARASLKPRAFDDQFSEVDDLLDAQNKLAYVQALAADDVALIHDRYPSSSNGRFSRSSNPFAYSSTTQAVGSSGYLSNTLRSGSSTVFNILDEDGRPHAHVVERWLKNVKPPARSDARLTGRGVDCRLNLHGKVCEWVIFL